MLIFKQVSTLSFQLPVEKSERVKNANNRSSTEGLFQNLLNNQTPNIW